MNDAQLFLETREALTLLGLEKNRRRRREETNCFVFCFYRLGIENKIQMSIFRLLSSILHLGNVIINEGDEETTFIQESDRSFATFASLLKIDPSRMRTWLCNKRIKTGVEVVNTTLNLNQVRLLFDVEMNIFNEFYCCC